MPSYCSRNVGAGDRSVTSVGVDVPVPHVDDRVTLADLGLVLELLRGAGDVDDVAERTDALVAAVEDEDAVGGGRVAVTGRVLQVEAAQRGRSALVVADDDAFRRDGAGIGAVAPLPGSPRSE